jgi:integrase
MKLTRAQRVRYIRNGKSVRKGTPGAVRVKEQSRKFYARLRINGRQRWYPLDADRVTAQKMMRELLVNKFKLRLGISDLHADQRKKPLSVHVADYISDLRSRGRRQRTIKDVKRMLEAALPGDLPLGDLTLDRLDTFLSSLAKQGRSSRTRNSYRAVVLAFANWLVKKNRLPANLLTHATKAGEQKVRVRRALSLGEIRKLLTTTRQRSPERALLYLTAICTGLCRSELASLRVCDLRLDAMVPSIRLDGSKTKNRRDAELPIPAALATQLRGWIESKRPGDAVFFVPEKIHERIYGDLKAAGIATRDAEGRVVDLHSLRKCTATLLAAAGVNPKVAQQFLRHSDINLTMSLYTDSALIPLTDAVEVLGRGTATE